MSTLLKPLTKGECMRLHDSYHELIRYKLFDEFRIEIDEKDIKKECEFCGN